MCGIVGYYSKLDTKDSILEKMGNAIKHRGPDGFGYWYNDTKNFKVCHRRLSIIDLSENGKQPMISSDKRWIISFNGEIYNYLEIKNNLIAEFDNIIFNSNTDTEIILIAIEKWGLNKTLDQMLGMFAIVLWDDITKDIYLIRDRAGEKPLYYGLHNETFFFTSELKALFPHPNFEKKLNKIAVVSYFKYNYVPTNLCIYENIFKVTPGTYIKFNTKSFSIDNYQYWDITNIKTDINKNNNENLYVETLNQKLVQTISDQMTSDVPLGAFLSGGIDSSTVVAIMQKVSSKPINTFTIGFDDKFYDEAKFAKKIAKHLGTNHHEYYINQNDILSTIDLLPDIYDEPFSDSSQIPTYLVSKLAKKSVTVSLSGDGGDELFSGYNRYVLTENLWEKLKLLPTPFKNAVKKVLLSKNVNEWNNFFERYNIIIPKNLRFSNFGEKIQKSAFLMNVTKNYELYDYFISNSFHNNLYNLTEMPVNYSFNGLDKYTFVEKMMILDFLNYLSNDILVKVDRAAMYNSLETRVPFLDNRIIEYAWQIPQNLKIKNGQGKWILREILNKYVPKSFYDRPKMGFGIQIDKLLRGPLKQWANNLLSEKELAKHGLLNFKHINNIWIEHLEEKRNWQHQLWSILMFQSWYNKNFI